MALLFSSFFLEKNEAKLANAVQEVKTSLEKNRRSSHEIPQVRGKIALLSRVFGTTEHTIV